MAKNTFMNQLDEDTNFTRTENGGVAHSHLNNPVANMFAFAGSYRTRSDIDCINLFKEAFEYDETLALKCLFWVRDCRGGAGERRFFRVCLKWLAKHYPEAILRNLEYIPVYGRWDDLYALVDTQLELEALDFIKRQLKLDMEDCLEE